MILKKRVQYRMILKKIRKRRQRSGRFCTPTPPVRIEDSAVRENVVQCVDSCDGQRKWLAGAGGGANRAFGVVDGDDRPDAIGFLLHEPVRIADQRFCLVRADGVPASAVRPCWSGWVFR